MLAAADAGIEVHTAVQPLLMGKQGVRYVWRQCRGSNAVASCLEVVGYNREQGLVAGIPASGPGQSMQCGQFSISYVQAPCPL